MMLSYYASPPDPIRPLHVQFQPLSLLPPARPMPQSHIPVALDKIIRKRYEQGNDRFSNALSRATLNTERQRHCLSLVNHLRIYKNLFMRTYEHMIVCCQEKHLDWLVDYASKWGGWNSVQQLARHNIIRETLVSFGTGEHTCRKHKRLFEKQGEISDDDSDLLCLVLYCSRDEDLYDLSRKPAIRGFNDVVYKEFEHVIDLLYKFLLKQTNKPEIARRLRAALYRMARKSGYVPRGMQIERSSITSERPFPFLQWDFGVVKLGMMNGKDVVIKKAYDDGRLEIERIEMLASEAMMWKTLQHKNIVPFLGVVKNGSELSLVTPFFKNGNITRYLQTRNRQEWPTLAKRWAKDLAKALYYIHSHEPPIIHGNIKGDNVLVGDDGHACLADFGQSYSTDSAKYLDSMHVGRACGLFRWKAPELVSGGRHAKATVESDVYAFGCVLYEMIAGKFPFHLLLCDQELGMRVLRGERPSRPEGVDRNDAFWKVIEACWVQRPEDRPSAKRLMDLLS